MSPVQTPHRVVSHCKGIDKIIRIALEFHGLSWFLVYLLKKHVVHGACVILNTPKVRSKRYIFMSN